MREGKRVQAMVLLALLVVLALLLALALLLVLVLVLMLTLVEKLALQHPRLVPTPVPKVGRLPNPPPSSTRASVTLKVASDRC